MSQAEEDQFRDLIVPIKDLEKSFSVDIANLLEIFVKNFKEGKGKNNNFNSAALVLQGSSSVYSKKVEYLYNLASNLHEVLTKTQKDGSTKKKDPKDKTPRQIKHVNPFCSTEIKLGKNLSCLRRKNVAKVNAANKKSQKKVPDKKHAFVPVDLLPLECEEKGDVFYDNRGDPIGNKSDYTLNKCRVTTSGWLLLPTVSADNISEMSVTLDYPPEIVDDNHCDSDVEMTDTPADEGYPASSGCPSSPPTAPSSQNPSQVTSSDEGLGSLPCTPSEDLFQLPNEVQTDVNPESPMEVVHSPTGDENIPMDGVTEEDPAVARPVRRSMRQALRLRQLDDPEQGDTTGIAATPSKEEVVAVKKAIQKKNTCHLPSKLRSVNDENASLHPASVFCARTFFSVDNRLQNSNLSLKVTAFANNSKFISKIDNYKDCIKASKSKDKARGDEKGEVEVDEAEVLAEVEADADVLPANPALDYDDFVIDNEPLFPTDGDENPIVDEIPMDTPATEGEFLAVGGEVAAAEGEGLAVEVLEAASPVGINVEAEYARAAEEQLNLFNRNLASSSEVSELTQRVWEWQKKLKPFLREISTREKFDINLYGSRILNAFEDSNRRQTMIFRDFCKDKEKWEIHRYFMALLPLANTGNVDIENQDREEGEEPDIAITLLSRKMHHMELEEFGHSKGEHS